MRTLLFLLAGFLLGGPSFILGKIFMQSYPEASTWATSLFIVVWLDLAAANLMAGVARASYTTRMSFRRRRRRSRPSAEQRDTVHTYDVGVGFTNYEFNLFGRGVGAATAQRLPKISLALYDGRPADRSPGGQKLAAELS